MLVRQNGYQIILITHTEDLSYTVSQDFFIVKAIPDVYCSTYRNVTSKYHLFKVVTFKIILIIINNNNNDNNNNNFIYVESIMRGIQGEIAQAGTGRGPSM